MQVQTLVQLVSHHRVHIECSSMMLSAATAFLHQAAGSRHRFLVATFYTLISSMFARYIVTVPDILFYGFLGKARAD